jgi:hypothetical protein
MLQITTGNPGNNLNEHITKYILNNNTPTNQNVFVMDSLGQDEDKESGVAAERFR